MAREKELLLCQINAHSFACNDLQLFLDTHPNCKEAFAELKKHLKARAAAVKVYEERYGALTADGLDEAGAYCWMNDPWPWEKED